MSRYSISATTIAAAKDGRWHLTQERVFSVEVACIATIILSVALIAYVLFFY
jgi:hypothetical protein